MINKTGNKTLGTPKTYLELITSFPPRKITSEEELTRTQNIIDELLDQGNLTPDERDYLHLLGLVVSEYEDQNYPIRDIYGVELLKVLMAELNLQFTDLISIFEDETILSDVIAGKQTLTIEHIEKLSDFFHIDPSVFLRNV
ncbi:type II toxin-antitoxin system HigA family antitoxin [Sphaerospermopsis sp. LEGE 08334]|jgi:HTH-type transcriptional regulator/antitoxin HigA|uniref:helix-turn-helix domain-containing protein n=1 Tax=Sphaerospermopsis sp. LEGE 08334 TaxID=1828651 RepID=UPI00187E05BE|nr:transcriptional regulator [Sphaerospermopsis sp. LEGE 08334]MBE9057571.1 transcriptional regulator [Sphaerospermopsis sp. LEGE 08334]